MNPPSTTVHDKAIRLLKTGAVAVKDFDRIGLEAAVKGDHAVYAVIVTETGAWCTCPAQPSVTCAHRWAVHMIRNTIMQETAS